jgi:predicted nuclease of predicted toxin-antitoxin system
LRKEPKRKSYEQWLEEQERRDPNFLRDVAMAMRRRAPPRKVPLLCDESLECQLIDGLASDKGFKVHRVPTGRGDDFIWREASQRGLILVTADEDLWDDHSYPLRDSPGVVILRGRNATERRQAFARLFAHYELAATYAKFGADMLSMTKSRASPDNVFEKFLDRDGSVVELSWDD